jgi:alkylation response protein AidB-like acyl-CoA dehydrogenase
MDLELSDEQLLLQQCVREFLEGTCTIELVRRLQEPDSNGHSAELWSKLTEGGWLGMSLAEEYGGADSSLFDLGLFYQEAGRVLLPTPFYTTTHAMFLIEQLGTEAQKREYLASIVAGDMVGTIAFAELNAIHDPCYLQTKATRDSGTWTLSGRKAFVANASVADPLIVLARTAPGDMDGLTAFLVPRSAPGIGVTQHRTFAKDNQCLVELRGVTLDDTQVLGGLEAVDSAWTPYSHATDIATALQSMEMAGGARKVLELTVAHVKQRHQFGVPIGSFQAVHHHAANMMIAVDAAQLAAMQAIWLLAEGHPASRAITVAKSAANAAYVDVTVLAHQLHGGIGYVREVDLHLWSQRAKAAELSFGTSNYHLDRLATSIGL